jgi:dTDP-glucose 4,6-dehydratase
MSAPAHTAERILITGGAGFIGANFTHFWAERHAATTIFVADKLTYAGNLQSIQSLIEDGHVHFEHADIADTERMTALLVGNNIDTIINFAAETHVDRSIHGPELFVQANVVGTASLLQAASAAWGDDPARGRFHHVSTDEVYGSLGVHEPAFTEMHPMRPNSPYAASKASADMMVRAYAQTYGLNTTTTNCSNNYGPYQFPEKLIPLTLLNIINGKPLPIYGNGLQIRDWFHVHDHCRAIDLVLREGVAGETYNVGGNAERTNLELVHQLCAIVDAKRPECAPADRLITHVEDRPGHDRRYAVNIDRISRELNFQPEFELERGLSETVSWYLDNEAWWRTILSGDYREWVRQQYGGKV